MSTRQVRRRQQRVAQSRGKPVRRSATPWYLSSRALIVAVAAVALVVVLIIVSGSKSPKPKAALFNPQPVPAAVLSAVTNPSAATVSAVGSGGNHNPWTKISGPLLTSGGKPELVYVGAEYCPYCAAERWPMVNALSRFGTISGLRLMKSSSTDSPGPTDTFTTRDLKFSSPYLTFAHVETTNNLGPNHPLQTPTAVENTLVAKYDTGGGIPFIDWANRATTGVGYDVGLLRTVDTNANSAPLSWQQIASDLTRPTSPQARGIIGDANWITAGICKVTNNKPGSTCQIPAIRRLESQVGF
jgi:Domain of unknown function (DUF929)